MAIEQWSLKDPFLPEGLHLVISIFLYNEIPGEKKERKTLHDICIEKNMKCLCKICKPKKENGKNYVQNHKFDI